METHQLRLLDCCIVNEEDDEAEEEGTERIRIHLFGLNERGETFKIIVDDFQPFLFCKVPDTFTAADCDELREHIVKTVGKKHDGAITGSLYARHKLYGFDARRKYRFACFHMKNMAAYHKVKNLWFEEVPTKEESKFNRRPGFKWAMRTRGYYYRGVWLELYEAHIPPILRFYHIYDISPTGWIEVTGTVSAPDYKTSSCTYEIQCHCRGIQSLKTKETVVPYKICSFDIEASSQTGDFPLPVSDYRRLAQQILEVGEVQTEAQLRTALKAAFGFAAHTHVERVYPKRAVSEAAVDACLEKWLNLRLESVELPAAVDLAGESSDEEGDDAPLPLSKETVAALVQGNPITAIMLSAEIGKDVKLTALASSLNATFPALKGDEVTFIGSTFVRYGTPEPYLNHCIAVGDTTPVPGVALECYGTERELLLAWTALLQREDPDIIIGYNIFGFDEEFLFRRALENDCAGAFLKLTRNKAASAAQNRDGVLQLEEKSVFLATGEYSLKYFNLEGRLQIDLYTMFRKEQYNFESYKLDDVAAIFIRDKVARVDFDLSAQTMKVVTKKMKGIAPGNFVVFEYMSHSSNFLMQGHKFQVVEVGSGYFVVDGCIDSKWQLPTEVAGYFHRAGEAAEGGPPPAACLNWCLVKDDVDHHQIFAWAKGSPDDRAKIAAYCVQDCNLVHHLFQKVDVLTAYVEMGNVCSVTLKDIVFRGQGIKLTSFIAKKCREHKVLMPVLPSVEFDEGYEGADVLTPKCGIYTDDPVGVCDYSSLYPSDMIAYNLSQDSKVSVCDFDLAGKLLPSKVPAPPHNYDNLPGYKYIDCEYDRFKYVRKTPKGKAEKVKIGVRRVRWAQFPDGQKAIMPMVLDELLKARKATRKKAEQEPDEFMRNIYDKRQLAYKTTANSLYGQCGARTSSFYDKDVAACTTAFGRKLLNYAKTLIEEVYQARVCETVSAGTVTATAEYVYGDTDSVFFKFTLIKDGVRLRGMDALPVTIELAKEAGRLATQFLSPPHDLEYEKTFYPFILLSKKRYVGMLYEDDPTHCSRKSMGIVLKRRDNAAIVKDVYGGLIDLFMRGDGAAAAVAFLQGELEKLVQGKVSIEKLKITKSLRSGYKNPKQIAHKVLAERIGVRDPGNKPKPGDRIQFIYVKTPKPAKGVHLLQGDKIETPEYVRTNQLQPDMDHYIERQIMKPVQQLLALVLEAVPAFDKAAFDATVAVWREKYAEKPEKWEDKYEAVRQSEIKRLLFAPYLHRA
jgi:DNA polymerase elongation subunit (family B)